MIVLFIRGSEPSMSPAPIGNASTLDVEAAAPDAVRVRELQPVDFPRWDEFVSGCPEATFFHRAGWKTAIERAFGHRTKFLYAEAGGRIEGVLPAPGTAIFKDGQEVGELRSGSGERALAMLRLDAVKPGQKLTAGGAGILPEIPAWMRLPETTDP